MSIAFNAAVFGGLGSPVTSLTYSQTVGAGSNRLLVVGTTTDANSNNVTGVTYAGVAMTLLDKSVTGALNRDTTVYYLLNPASGANNVVVSLAASGFVRALSADYSGVSATGQPDATAKVVNTAGPITVNITTVADNSWTIGVMGSYSDTVDFTGSAGSTLRITDGIGSTGLYDHAADIHPAGATSLTGDWSGGSKGYSGSMIVGSFAPAVAAVAGRILPVVVTQAIQRAANW